MAEIVVPGPLSGRRYGFTIAGEQPTSDEQDRIDSLIRQWENEAAQEARERYGAELEGVEGGFFDYPAEFFKGIGRGAIGFGETAALGAAAALPEKYETPTREAIRGVARSMTRGLQPDIGFEGDRAAEIVGGLGAGVGSFGALAGTSLLPGGAFIAPGLAIGAGAGEASERARRAGATVEERSRAALLGAPVGATEMLPLLTLQRALGGEFTGQLISRLRRIAAQGGIEGAQEAAANIAQNLIQQNVYDPTTGTFTGTGEAFGYGAGTGAIVQGLLDLVIPRKRGATPPPPPAPLALPAPPPAPPALPAPPRALPAPSGPSTGPATTSPAPAPTLTPAPTPTPAFPSADAAATARSIGSDPQMLTAAEAIEKAGKATIPVIQQALGLSYSAARGVMKKLENVGAVSAYKPGKPRTLTLPFKVSAIREAAAPEPATPEAAAPAPEPEATPEAAAPAAPEAATPPAATPPAATPPAATPPATPPAATPEPEPEAATPPAEYEPVLSPEKRQVASRFFHLPQEQKDALLAALGMDINGFTDLMLSNPAAVNAEIDRIESAAAPAAAPEPEATVSPGEYNAYGRGETINVPMRYPEPNIPRTPGRVLETQAAAQREPIRQQLATRTRLENEAKELRDVLASRRQLAARAKEEGVKPSAVKKNLTQQLNRTQAQLYNVNSYLRSPEGRAQAAAEGTAEFGEQRLAAENDELRDQLRSWYETNAPAEVQAYDADIRGEVDYTYASAKVAEAADVSPAKVSAALRSRMEEQTRRRDPSTPADKRALLDLLNMTPAQLKKDKLASAAHAYFSKTRDMADALDNIAFDLTDPDVPARRRGRPAAGAPLEAYWKGTGRDVAEKAAEWVDTNLSEEGASNYMNEAVASNVEGKGKAMGDALDKQIMKRRERDEAEQQILKSYIEAAAATRGKPKGRPSAEEAILDEAMEIPTEDGITLDELRERRETGGFSATDLSDIGIDFGSAIQRMPRVSIGYGLIAPVHPVVKKMLEIGNLRGALSALSATSTDKYVSRLAARLANFVGDTKVHMLSPTQYPNSIEAALLFDDVRGEYSAGIYLNLTREESARWMAEGVNQDELNAYQNSIVLNADDVLTPHLILHEVLHAALARELNNASSAVRARLETLRKQVAAQFPDEYGVTDVYEFSAEALTNPEFQAVLSSMFPNKTRVSAFTQFGRVIQNFMRRILGMQPKVYDDNDYRLNALDEVDYLVQGVMAPAPKFIASRPLGEDAIRPLRAQEVLNGMSGRIKDFTGLDNTKIEAMRQDTRIPMGVKGFINDAFIPLRNLTEYAKKYFPMADEAYELVTQHNRAVKQANETARVTIERISDFFKNNPDQVTPFNQMRTLASLFEIDPRRPRDAYAKFSLTYHKTDAQGLPTERVYERFDTARERDERIVALNADETAARGRARRANDPDPDTLKTYDTLRTMYNNLSPEGQRAYSTALALFEAQHKDAARVFKARIESMLPQQRRLQEAVYKQIFNKLFSEQILDAYQPLQREGQHWLYYEAKDPVTGVITPFKESFSTSGERVRYVAELRALPDSAGLNKDSIKEYRKIDAQFFDPGRPSSRFVADVGVVIQKEATAAAEAARKQVLDAGGTKEQADAAYNDSLRENTTRAAALQRQIVELALNMMPERSFLQTYRKREGVRGFIGDATLVERNLDASDTINLFLRKSASLSRQLADMEFGAKASALERRMQEHYATIEARLTPGEQESALSQLRSMADGLKNIYVDRHPAVKTINALTFAMTLGFNLSSPIMNVMAVPTIVLPYLSGKYGTMQSAKALMRGVKFITASGTEKQVEIIKEDATRGTATTQLSFLDHSLENYTFETYDPSLGYDAGTNAKNKYATLQEAAARRGLFVDSIAYDTLDIEGMTGQGLWLRFNKMSGFMMHQTEKLVRESTLVALYDLELQRIAKSKGTDKLTQADLETAARNAAYETELTNGTIPAAGAPNLSQRGIWPMIYMFKRYPLAIYNMLGTTLARAYPGKAKLAELYGEGTPEYQAALEARNIARMQFGMVTGSVGLWAGAAGLPMYGAVSALFNTLFTDDDEENFDTIVRTGIGELGFKGLGNYLFGVEMSSRIGLANMFYREPLRAEEQPPLWNIIEGGGGPAVSILNAWLTRVPEFMSQGEYYRALEAAVPAAVRNVLRSARFATTGGAESLRDDIIADLGPLSVVGQFMGFAPAHYIRQLEVNTQLKKIDNAINAERQQLLRRVNLARRNADSASLRAAMEDIQAFNQRHPQSAIIPETLRRSAQTFERTTQKVNAGIVYSDKNREMLLRMAREIESPSTIYEALGIE